MITKDALLNTGKNKGLTNKEHIEKSYFQDLFLFNLYKKTNLFIFKGGTLLYKLYNLKRFSEDLDFSLAESKNDEELKAIIKDVVSEIEGFEIKDIRKLKGSLLIKISCRGILTKYNTLRIDISLKNSVFLGYELKNYSSDYIDISPFSLRALKPEEIVAEKIHCLFNRRKARDLYDLFFLLKQYKFDKDLTVKKLSVFNYKYSLGSVKTRISDLEIIWEAEIKHFVLEDMPDFKIVRDYVVRKLEGL
jgi:predicted nucleotidyltransferase component of viral defense system